jgi:hypothetical protein
MLRSIDRSTNSTLSVQNACGRTTSRILAIRRHVGELKTDALADHPKLVITPIWYRIIHNGLLDRSPPIYIGDLFEAHLDLLFGR